MKVKNQYLKILEYFIRSIKKKDLQNRKVQSMLIYALNTWSGLL